MKRFNLRVYGIIVNENDEVLLADERRFGANFTKFPGGGLEWGEGLKDALSREIQEEIGLPCEIGELFYVNDFFQQSAFHKDDQLMSFYFFVHGVDFTKIQTVATKILHTEDGEWFRWVPRTDLSEDVFSFPLDKIVCKKLATL